MKNIASALVKAQKAFGPALKSSTNPHFRSRYADLSACVEAVITGLNDNGIALIQQTHDSESGVCVETLFLHESGESLSAGKLHVPATKQDAQGYGSALTYARRYSLMAACGIAPEDDDGNAASRPSVPQVRTTVTKVIAPATPKQDPNWFAKVESVIGTKAESATAYLISKGEIKVGQLWNDLPVGKYRDNLLVSPEKFLAAVAKWEASK
jgi:hypothetical protein